MLHGVNDALVLLAGLHFAASWRDPQQDNDQVQISVNSNSFHRLPHFRRPLLADMITGTMNKSDNRPGKSPLSLVETSSSGMWPHTHMDAFSTGLWLFGVPVAPAVYRIVIVTILLFAMARVGVAIWLASPSHPQEGQHCREATASSKRSVRCVATFTVDPIRDVLEWWGSFLGAPMSVEICDYNSMFVQLLQQGSAFDENTAPGVNVVFYRLEDIAQAHGTACALDVDAINELLDDFANAVDTYCTRTVAAPLLLMECKPTPGKLLEHVQAAGRLRALLNKTLLRSPGRAAFVPWEVVDFSYDVVQYHDPESSRLGNMPYTDDYFVSLGTVVTRKIVSLTEESRFKVLMLDCDNTLWRGVAAEDEPSLLGINGVHVEVQKVAAQLHSMGLLVCLLSKNDEQDVEKVWESRASDMPLKKDMIVASKINWLPKSENLAELARTLNLGLDSIIFVDDSPSEIALMQQSHPQVLCVHLPVGGLGTGDGAAWAVFKNAWCFDRFCDGPRSEEDANRTEKYKDNFARAVAQDEAIQGGMSFEQFLKTLNVQAKVQPMTDKNTERAAQLSQKTNQFNTMTTRLSEADLRRAAAAEGQGVLVCDVKDRFGDYGLVLILVWRVHTISSTLWVDEFAMSCRVFDKGVERSALLYVADLAKNKSCDHIAVPWNPTPKNQGLRGKFQKISEAAGGKCEHTETGLVWIMPIEEVAKLSIQAFLSVTRSSHPDELGLPATKTESDRAILGYNAKHQVISEQLQDVGSIMEVWKENAGLLFPSMHGTDSLGILRRQSKSKQKVSQIVQNILALCILHLCLRHWALFTEFQVEFCPGDRVLRFMMESHHPPPSVSEPGILYQCYSNALSTLDSHFA